MVFLFDRSTTFIANTSPQAVRLPMDIEVEVGTIVRHTDGA